MAEARRLDEEEEAPRPARSRPHSCHPGPDRSERNKPEHRSSSQGRLSSIKAAIKRTSRTSHSEQHRDRRRPEITIVAAEPLRPTSWFPGASPALGFPSSPSPGAWRPNEAVPAELPPSYEQVIKEINQVQVNTTNNNAAATPRNTITSATQTDFPEEIISRLPGSDENNQPAPCVPDIIRVHASLKPPRPPSPQLTANLLESVAPLIVFDISEEQNCHENPSAGRCPVPRPRSKSNLRPVARDIQTKAHDHQEVGQTRTNQESSPSQSLAPLDSSLLDSQVAMNSMNTERNQNSIVSRIKAFESQTNAETSGLPRRPEIAPRTYPARPAVPAGKPALAPKPGANRASEEWNIWAENKPRNAPKEGPSAHSQPPETGSSPIAKPEVPKKPKPSLIKSTSNDCPETPDGEKKPPTPAPRPLLPKKLVSVETPSVPPAALKPVTAAPRLSVAAQAKAFRALEEAPAAILPPPPVQSRPVGERDLISFDDDVLPAASFNLAGEALSSEAALDPFQLPTKTEPTKEPAVQAVPTRKPTVIRIPAKPAKSLHEDLHSPPPLPAEKPIGNTSVTAAGKSSNAEKTRNLEPEGTSQPGNSWKAPMLPPRPADGKVAPARPPLPKGAPGRPPPPKLSAFKMSSQKEAFPRSSSDMDLQKKTSTSALGLKRTKSQVLKDQEPVLPPRPKPGHPLYRKYVLPVPHGIASEDILSPSPGELPCKRGEVLVLLEQAENNYLECQKGEETGRVHLSHMKIITPLEHLENRPKDAKSIPKVTENSAPHALVLHDFPAEQADDLNLSSGETVYLLEKIDSDWYRGKCRNQTGIFPANYVKVIIDVPEGGDGKKGSASSHHLKGPRCVARFEYIGDQKDELTFSEGETILLKEYVNEEWAKGVLKGKTGIFPLNFVEIIEDLPEYGANAPSVTSSQKNKKETSSISQDSRHSGEWCEALHDFIAESSEDLSFKKGDNILIIKHLNSEWFKGRLNNREGIFPAVFVRSRSGPTAGAVPLATAGQKKEKARALYDFHGENDDELSFKAGDTITELESVDEEWMSGELAGKSGIFPKNYVQVLPAS
ncbi:SH3 domain-containing protein 19 [Tachyglossus aculeatus]|uniref:SH3 domain-containing protein 19 n=1 Tax=Tachyglossus aculeatus TaxID=9261 RepID=UPI0018F4552A|nr:SH3 domain-containing protein 19 [Tachyglossus aculeatus]